MKRIHKQGVSPSDPPEPGTEPSAAPHVAFQGEAGAFSEEALFLHFGEAHSLPCKDFATVGKVVRSGEAEYGVLPVENTLAGSVQAAYDVLAAGDLTIVGEVVIPIRHFLLGVPGSRISELRRVISHPVALAQCMRFLSARPQIEVVAVYDTAGAAMEVRRGGDPQVAAVAARGAAGRYGLEILEEDIQDREDNQTRFYVVRLPRENAPRDVRSGSRKTVVLLEVEDEPGSLLRVLEPFARRGINLSKLESRPGEVPWRYRFVLELRADREEPAAREALAEVLENASALTVLGSFPAAARSGS